jgi:GDSL-like Lipase/Acylhydrolase family
LKSPLLVMLSCALALVASPLRAAGQSAPAPLTYTPLATPCRAVDTRTNLEPIQGGTTRNFSPFAGGCNIQVPADGGIVYVANVTVAPQGPMWYLTVWPAGEAQPNVSLLNSYDGRTKANAALINGGTNGDISVFASNTTDFVLDISGYFSASASGLVYVPVPPCRVIDTRNGTGGGALTPDSSRTSLGPLPANQAQTFDIAYPNTVDDPVPNANACNLPYSVGSAYSVNVTVVPINNQPVWATSIWGANATPPPANTAPAFSNVNVYTGTDTANAAIINGPISLSAFSDVGTNLVIDVTGWFAPASVAPEGLSLYALPPCRALDTRESESDGLPAAGLTVTLSGEPNVACPLPAGVPTPNAFVLNATVIPTSAVGYLTLWPYGQAVPVVSTLNANDCYVTSNMAIVGTGPLSSGSSAQAILAQASTASKVDLVLDESGIFALNPATYQPKVVFIGDETTSEWPMANQPNWINKGVPGNTTAQMLARFQTDVLDLHPDVVHIMGGANDAIDEDWPMASQCGIDTCMNLGQMAQMAESAGIKVVIGTPIFLPNMTLDQQGDLADVARQMKLSLMNSAIFEFLVDYQDMGGSGYTAMTSMAEAEIGYAYGTPMAAAAAQHLLGSTPR